jgi:N-acyl-D-aspartate/D-glutamate deacylase
VHDLVVRGATLCDGTGSAARRADVAVRDGIIVDLGAVAGPGRIEIDATDRVLSPGFVDVHTHYDCQLFWDPMASPSPWHGVTTVVTGNCGFTLAPCRPEHRETLMRLLCFVEGMPLETLRAGLPWTWESFAEYLDALEAAEPAVNVAAFVGHSALRFAVMGADALERPATDAERRALVAGMREAMDAGALGWSTSLAPTHFFADDGKPAPSRVADRAELLALAEGLRDRSHGVIEVAPQLIVASAEAKIEEQAFFAALARASGKTVSWAPLFQNEFFADAGLRCLDDAARWQAQGVAVVPQVGCRPLELHFDFANPSFGLENNPVWRERMGWSRDVRRAFFADPEGRAALAADGGGFVASLAPTWDRLILRLPAGERTRRWQDRSVAEIATALGTTPVEAFCDTVLADDLEGQWGAVLMNADEAQLVAMIRHPASVLALSDAGAHMDTLCDQGFSTHLLGHWVRERAALSLEEAVRLLTSEPATRYGLNGRGCVRLGAAADLVVFDAARVACRPTEMVYDLPGGRGRLVQGADGIEWVIVNGRAVVERGVPTGRRSGRVLREHAGAMGGS